MKLLTIILRVGAFIAFASALPNAKRELDPSGNYFAISSQILATNLLKDNIDIDGNHVHSPLGIATVLAILAEGSRGETYNEFISSLGYPKEKIDLRNSAKDILRAFHRKDISITPAFKTWFYVYRNNTVKDGFKQIVRDYYSAEVKDIERSQYDWNNPSTSQSSGNSKDIIDFETLKSEKFDDDKRKKDDAVAAAEDEQKRIDEVIERKEASKFDKVVDDKQYVEVPVIKEEIAKEQQQHQKQKLENEIKDAEPESIDRKETEIVETANDEDNETIRDAEKIEELKKDLEPSPLVVVVDEKSTKSSEPEKISIPLKKLEELEIMQTAETESPSRRYYRSRALFLKDDVTSALSANSIIGKDPKGQTKILLFNGLYYRGSWLNPFQQLRRGPEDVFHVNSQESMPVTMMRVSGEFKTAKVDELNSQVIEFPYEDSRHALLVIVPNEKEGLRHLIENLQLSSLTSIRSRLQTDRVSVCLPKFQIDSTSRSESMLKTIGLRKLFSAEADLGEITEDDELYVDEIVQHVNIRVDEGSSSKQAISGTAASGAEVKSPDSERSILVNRPFLYFVLNRSDNFVLVVGKIMAPEVPEENTF